MKRPFLLPKPCSLYMPGLHQPHRQLSEEVPSPLAMRGLQPLAIEGMDHDHQHRKNRVKREGAYRAGVGSSGGRWFLRRGINQLLLPPCQGEGESLNKGVITVPGPSPTGAEEWAGSRAGVSLQPHCQSQAITPDTSCLLKDFPVQSLLSILGLDSPLNLGHKQTFAESVTTRHLRCNISFPHPSVCVRGGGQAAGQDWSPGTGAWWGAGGAGRLRLHTWESR